MKDGSKSFAMQEKAKRLIPGMTQLLAKRPDRFSLGVWPGYYERCSGARVWDLDGNEYLDMSIAGIGANVLGYADPDVDGAVREAVARGVSCSLNCPEEVELAELLVELHPWAQMVRYTRAGGEAMALAVRIARASTGRDKVAICGYHGWHDWYLAANLESDSALNGHHISGLDPRGTPSQLWGTAMPFRYNRLDELEAIVAANGKDLAAVVMEPIRSFQPDPGFIAGVRELADRAGAVLIVDEISAGLRLASGGAHLKVFEGVVPDMAVFSKALGNGYAIGAVIGVARVMEAVQRSFISSTCWTERIGPTAALATLRKHIRLDAATRLVALGESVQQGWARLGRDHCLDLDIGGIPPLSHFSFKGPAPRAMKAYFVQGMLDRGILASTLYYAMFVHTDDDVDAYLRAAGEVFAELRGHVDAGRLEAALRGQPATTGFDRIA